MNPWLRRELREVRGELRLVETCAQCGEPLEHANHRIFPPSPSGFHGFIEKPLPSLVDAHYRAERDGIADPAGNARSRI